MIILCFVIFIILYYIADLIDRIRPKKLGRICIMRKCYWHDDSPDRGFKIKYQGDYYENHRRKIPLEKDEIIFTHGPGVRELEKIGFYLFCDMDAKYFLSKNIDDYIQNELLVRYPRTKGYPPTIAFWLGPAGDQVKTKYKKY